jgi:hypothetical protein
VKAKTHDRKYYTIELFDDFNELIRRRNERP